MQVQTDQISKYLINLSMVNMLCLYPCDISTHEPI